LPYARNGGTLLRKFYFHGKRCFMLNTAPAIILVRPQLPENIGMVARAMGNFDLKDLRLVAPRETLPHPAATAAGANAAHLLDNVPVFASVRESIADLHVVYAATARPREQYKQVESPAEAIPVLHTLLTQNMKAGILFGPERTGLTNDEIMFADRILTFPVNPQLSSLNLSQAVLLFGSAWYNHVQGSQPPFAALAHSAPATKQQFDAFFERFEASLEAAGYFYPPAKRPQMRRNLRNIFQRLNPSEQEVRTLHGVISALSAITRVLPKKVVDFFDKESLKKEQI
jgi:tRNA/rRNA methyltransferase